MNRSAVVLMTGLAIRAMAASTFAAGVPMPSISGPVTSPGMMYPNPPQLIADGWFLPEYADMVKADAGSAAIPSR